MRTFILLLLFSSFLSAKTFAPHELAQLAEEHAPLVKISLEQENVSKSQVKQAHLLGNPIVTYQGGRLKSATQSGQITDLSIMQPVPWPGKRSHLIKSQEFLNKIASMDVGETKLMLAHRVYLLAYELAADTEMETHHKERKERFSLMMKYLTSRPLASPKQQLEKDLIESQIRLVEKLMNQLTARKNSLKEEISLLTGATELEVQVDWKNLPSVRDRNFYASNLGSGFRLKKLGQTLRLSENRIEEARLQARPDIMVGLNYRQENVAPVNHFYHGQVAVVIPIVDRGQHSVQAARAQVRKDEASIQLAQQELQTELSYAYESLLAAQNGLKLFPLKLRHESETRFEKAEVAFRKGQIDIMTFLQSDNQVHENIDLVYTSRVEYLGALSRLEELVGRHMGEN